MGIPADPLLDIIRRSLVNLEFIDRNYREHAVYEITQLVNTFLGAFIHPFERSSKGKAFMAYFTARPPPIAVRYQVNECGGVTYYDFIQYVRHALAHGNMRYNPNEIKQIDSITLWNIRNGRKVLKCTIGTSDMKRLLLDFRDCLEEIYGH
ncbi:hypothetical protein CFR73_02020 [Novacetimonas maltaceti]|uniref:pEK499-p136 HEPN domain-containing protein n=1 Tax=Novacetimonas maltaceti TaxID=1203393 RepID=A0A2S3W5L8_9PROT|nr:HEPN family nuclease [Novacetimonas maltaceti]POF63833.1 hypothetical protein KMAL_05910 [Novacetimonas maltaceti]PYD61828.1 hypothetical protein CFR73_02020 [Novacetimonas maltaceti]